jgi:hypothetical protein
MSKREELRRKRQEAARRQQLIVIGAVAVAAIAIAGLLAGPTLIANLQPVGTVVAPDPGTFPQANGKTLGPQDARVVVQEFSDFK